MARVDPPLRNHTCPACNGSKRTGKKYETCDYCLGNGKVTEHRYKTLLRYIKNDPAFKRRQRAPATLH